jgi:hypothetical protein
VGGVYIERGSVVWTSCVRFESVCVLEEVVVSFLRGLSGAVECR